MCTICKTGVNMVVAGDRIVPGIIVSDILKPSFDHSVKQTGRSGPGMSAHRNAHYQWL